MALTRAELLEYGGGTQKGYRAENYRASSRGAATATVFLSHSHEDRDLVEPAANFLASLGVKVYVDWQDPLMPAITSADTARRIRHMIRVNKRFLLLATERSLGSRWVPWELGYADGEKAFVDIAVLPISEATYRQAPNEYIQVYQRIVEASTGDWYVFEPDENNSSLSVKDWLLR
ncbi:hypothetical protein BH23GEM9_BH23GEM9_20160 [soil metagenome]